jgi:hypothetical protein
LPPIAVDQLMNTWLTPPYREQVESSHRPPHGTLTLPIPIIGIQFTKPPRTYLLFSVLTYRGKKLMAK